MVLDASLNKSKFAQNKGPKTYFQSPLVASLHMTGSAGDNTIPEQPATQEDMGGGTFEATTGKLIREPQIQKKNRNTALALTNSQSKERNRDQGVSDSLEAAVTQQQNSRRRIVIQNHDEKRDSKNYSKTTKNETPQIINIVSSAGYHEINQDLTKELNSRNRKDEPPKNMNSHDQFSQKLKKTVLQHHESISNQLPKPLFQKSRTIRDGRHSAKTRVNQQNQPQKNPSKTKSSSKGTNKSRPFSSHHSLKENRRSSAAHSPEKFKNDRSGSVVPQDQIMSASGQEMLSADHPMALYVEKPNFGETPIKSEDKAAEL